MKPYGLNSTDDQWRLWLWLDPPKTWAQIHRAFHKRRVYPAYTTARDLARDSRRLRKDLLALIRRGEVTIEGSGSEALYAQARRCD